MKHKKLQREFRAKEGIKRDEHLHSMLSDPSSLQKQIKSHKRARTAQIKKLTVGNNVYLDNNVADGFFSSITKLKTKDPESFQDIECFNNFCEDYNNILSICKNGMKIPKISEKDSLKLLMKMKADVNDFYSVTPNY